MKINGIIRVNEKLKYKEEKKSDNLELSDFWDDKIEFTNNIKNNNIKTNKHNNIKKKDNNKNINSSIIINKVNDAKIHYNNYCNKITKNSKVAKNKIQKSRSEINLFPKNLNNKRFYKLYSDGLLSMKIRIEKSMEEKRKKENEYKNYSYSPKLNSHSPIIRNKSNKKEKQFIEKNNNIKSKNKIKNNDIYERNKKWKKTIEEKNIKKILLKSKNIETKKNFKPMINDCIMKTDESFINKNSIEYQAFIEKVKIIKNKENIYGKNQRNNLIFVKNKTKCSIELKKRNIIKNNKIKEMNRFKSFNNREVFNICNCRKKYGLNDFFNSNDYETNKNNKNNNFIFNENDLLSDKKNSDMNELFFKQQIFNSSHEPTDKMRQTCFNFNDALLKLVGKK